MHLDTNLTNEASSQLIIIPFNYLPNLGQITWFLPQLLSKTPSNFL
jgi:hypothetical protein